MTPLPFQGLINVAVASFVLAYVLVALTPPWRVGRLAGCLLFLLAWAAITLCLHLIGLGAAIDAVNAMEGN
jgi:hypothetical protein